MACNLTQGFTLDCRDSVGGIKEIYLANLDDKATLSSTNDGVIDTFTLSTGEQFYTYELRKQTSSFTENITSSDENGTLFYEQEATIQLSKMESEKRNELYEVGKSRVMMIVLDRNGKYWLLGEEQGLTLGGSGETGTAMGDLNGYSLTFTGQERVPAKEVEESLIDTLTAPAV